MPKFTVEYAIDDNDRIIGVNRNWDIFAAENEAPHLLAAQVLQKPLFDFISDANVQLVWRAILKNVRAREKAVEFDYRCDSLREKRFMRMRVAAHGGKIDFSSVILRTENSSDLTVLDAKNSRNDSLLVVCSWCKKMEINETEWDEAEIAVRRLNLIGQASFPQISHGICPACCDQIMLESSHSEKW